MDSLSSLYDVREAAAYCGVHVATFRAAIRQSRVVPDICKARLRLLWQETLDEFKAGRGARKARRAARKAAAQRPGRLASRPLEPPRGPRGIAVSERTLYYTAGLFDGEGSVTRQSQARLPRFHCNISQSQRNDGEEHLHALAEEWGVGTIYLQCPAKGPRAACYVWRIHRRQEVADFLFSIVADLRFKRARVEDALARMAPTLMANEDSEG